MLMTHIATALFQIFIDALFQEEFFKQECVEVVCIFQQIKNIVVYMVRR